MILQRPQLEAELTPGRDLDWAGLVAARRARRVRAGARDRSALHPLHVGHDGPAEGRRARQRRPRRRARLEHAERLRRAAGRGVLGGLRRRLGRRALLHRLRAAAVRRDDRALRGQAGRHPGCGRVLARDRGARRRSAVHGADRDPGDPQGGSARPSCSRAARCRRCARSSWPASAPIPTPTSGPGACSGAPWSITGGRPRPGWAMAASCRGLDPPPVKAGIAEPARCPAIASTSSTPTAPSCRPASRAPSRCACRCRPARSRRSGTTTSAASRRTSRATPAGT